MRMLSRALRAPLAERIIVISVPVLAPVFLSRFSSILILATLCSSVNLSVRLKIRSRDIRYSLRNIGLVFLFSILPT